MKKQFYFLFIVALLSISGNATAQTPKIDLSLKNVSLKVCMAAIENQCDYTFMYDNSIDTNQKVSMEVKNESLPNVLRTLFSQTPIRYELVGKHIVLKLKSNFNDDNGVRVVSGKVTDASGSALPGVTVQIKGTSKGTITDVNGMYSLSNVTPSQMIDFSFVGMKPVSVLVDHHSEINVSMVESTTGLNEVVVVGYGTEKKKDLTSAISTVNASEIANVPASSFASALQGKMAGVQITSDGSPGSSPSILIRGTGSIYNSNPLYVVDGMIVDNIDYLGPNDIQNISVLKDASASAIYGVRAANGVILITTKKGSKTGKIHVFLNSYIGSKNVAHILPMANGPEYITLYDEKMQYLGYPQNVVNYNDFNVSTNWFDQVLTSSFTNNDDLSIQGGTEKSSFNVGANYLRDNGLIKGNSYERLGFRTYYDFQLSKYVKTGLNVIFSSAKSRPYPGNVLVDAYKALPILPPTNQNGVFVDPTNLNIQVGQSVNPAAEMYYNFQWQNTYNAIANFFVDVNFLKYFTFNSTLGFNPTLNNYVSYTPIYSVSAFQQNTTNTMSKTRGQNNNTSWDNTITFEKTFHQHHHLKWMVGYSYRQQTTDNLYASASGLIALPKINASFLFLSIGSTDNYAVQASDDGSKEVQLSYISRLTYDYLHKYLLNVSFRADGSSKFPMNNRWGYFPSFGVGWVMSEEPFMKSISAINFLKLRGGWGLLGNDNIPSNIYRPTVNTDDYHSVIFGPDQNSGNGPVSHAATITQSFNPYLKWEVVSQTDVGLEVNMFSSRLNGTIDWYRKMTDNAIFPITSLGSSGIDPTGVWGNYANILNTGMEFTVGWIDRLNDRFSYNLNGNVSFNKNRMSKINAAGASYFDMGFSDTPNMTRTTLNEPVGEFFGYKVIGVFQNQAQIDATPHLPGAIPGDLIFQDVNKDGVIDASDRTFLGNPNPSLIYGFNVGFKYENIDFNMYTQGVLGNKIFNCNRMLRYQTENYDRNFYLHRWHGEGTSNSYPSAVMSNPTTPNSFYVENGSYFRIKTLQLGYTLPPSVNSALKVSKIRFYVNAENPFTFFSYNGFSPEVSSSNPLLSGVDRGVYPLSSVYTFGVNVEF